MTWRYMRDCYVTVMDGANSICVADVVRIGDVVLRVCCWRNI